MSRQAALTAGTEETGGSVIVSVSPRLHTLMDLASAGSTTRHPPGAGPWERTNMAENGNDIVIEVPSGNDSVRLLFREGLLRTSFRPGQAVVVAAGG